MNELSGAKPPGDRARDSTTLCDLRDEPIYVLLDNSLDDPDTPASILFVNPRRVVACDHPDQIDEGLEEVSRAQAAGYFAAGWLAYEVGYYLEPVLSRLAPPRDRTSPALFWFGIFDEPIRLTRREVDELLSPADAASPLDYWMSSPLPNVEEADYCRVISRIKRHIRAGDTYQINYTFTLDFSMQGNPTSLYRDLRQNQHVKYGSLIRMGDRSLVSLSPELFFKRQGSSVVCKPMKGTVARGRTATEDARNAQFLHLDEKNRAENVMIVDLLRNDLGKIAKPGSVRVDPLFEVERYETLFQLTSTVHAELQDGCSFREMVHQLFPCGSITGAPKIRTMELIRELEREPRGVYTGSIGYCAPNGDMGFNVAIRTLEIESANGRGRMGIGSGIVHDSDDKTEYLECLLKARFLESAQHDFDLIETILWHPDRGFWLLEQHLARLESSARHFSFRYVRQALLDLLDAERATLASTPARIRVLLSDGGKLTIASRDELADNPPGKGHLAVSPLTVDPANPFLHHKTTNRGRYDEERQRCELAYGAFEVLFTNTRGELTEGSRTNLFLEVAGTLSTPPLSCGVLPGTFRQHLLETRPEWVEERILTVNDLRTADTIFVGNSVRGLMEVSIAEDGCRDQDVAAGGER